MHSRASLKELKQIGSIFSLFDVIPNAKINKKWQSLKLNCHAKRIWDDETIIDPQLNKNCSAQFQETSAIEPINLQFSFFSLDKLLIPLFFFDIPCLYFLLGELQRKKDLCIFAFLADFLLISSFISSSFISISCILHKLNLLILYPFHFYWCENLLYFE